jgi:hypothetical protein
MVRKNVALLFALFFILAVAYGELDTPMGIWHQEDFPRLMASVIGRGLFIYVVSGMFPFALWGARGFRAANAKSLFIPWAILAPVLIALIEYGRFGAF